MLITVITLLSLISTSTSGSPNCLNSNWSVDPSPSKTLEKYWFRKLSVSSSFSVNDPAVVSNLLTFVNVFVFDRTYFQKSLLSFLILALFSYRYLANLTYAYQSAGTFFSDVPITR